MIYDDFITALQFELERNPELKGSLTFAEVLKNNGVLRHTLSIKKEDSNIAPCIPLDDFFQEYLEGVNIERIAEYVMSLYNSCADCSNYPLDLSWSEVRKKVFITFINYKYNTRVLESIPHIKLLDWALIFKLEAPINNTTGFITITNSLFDTFDISLNELIKCAYTNTSVVMPPKVLRLMDLVSPVINLDDCDDLNSFWIVTNAEKQYGSGAILCPEVIDFCEKNGLTDCYIIPSSIHEFIVVNVPSGFEKDGLDEMLGLVNDSPYVTRMDYLGSQVFKYKELLKEFAEFLDKNYVGVESYSSMDAVSVS